MAQVVRVIKGDPATIVAQINVLAATEEILTLTKTFSGGEFILTTDDTAPASNVASVLKGDPDTVAAAAPAGVFIICPTFSASQYVAVEK